MPPSALTIAPRMPLSWHRSQAYDQIFQFVVMSTMAAIS